MSEVDGGMRTNEHSGPWNSVNVGGVPDRTFDAALMAMFVSVFGGPGILEGLLQSMEVTPTSPASMTLRVGMGAAMVGPADDVQRICAIWPSRQQITLSRQLGNNDRIDLLGYRINATNRNGTLAVIEGTPANNPVAPAIPDAQTRDAYFFELAQVDIIGGSNSISAARITDTRTYANLGGGTETTRVAFTNENDVDVGNYDSDDMLLISAFVRITASTARTLRKVPCSVRRHLQNETTHQAPT